MITLSVLDLSIAAILVLAFAALSLYQGLGMSKQVLIAATRTVLQLMLVGFTLKIVFDQANFYWVLLLALIMLSLATWEVNARQKHRFTQGRNFSISALSMGVSAFSTVLVTLTVMINATPWYEPQYAIPLLGMVLGNTMSGVALSLDKLSQTAMRDKLVIEGKLLMGMTRVEAFCDIRRDAVRSGMIPIINGMVAAGIISLPGMMTGQILAGSPPMEAVKYQILIMFLLCSTTGFAVVFATALASNRLFDERQRLRLDRLR